jgi:hypothetical protein
MAVCNRRKAAPQLEENQSTNRLFFNRKSNHAQYLGSLAPETCPAPNRIHKLSLEINSLNNSFQTPPGGTILALPWRRRTNAMIMISRPEFAQLHRATRSGTPAAYDAAATPPLAWPANEIMLRTLLRTGRSAAEIGALHGVDAAQIAGLRNQFDI